MRQLVTASQLRRKRRDATWFKWIRRHELYKNKLAGILKKYFARERERVLDVLNRVTLRAAEIPEEPITGAQLFELEYQLRHEQDDNNDDWEDTLLLLLLLIAANFTNLTVYELDFGLDDLEQTTDISTPTPIPVKTESWTRDFIQAALALIAATTLKRIISTIQDARDKKLSVPATITRINEAYEKFLKNRAPGIASDLVGKVASMAQQIAILQLPVPADEIRQTWVSMRDAKVRDSHEELDGVTRKVGEEFKPDLKFPRDPAAPIEESINCRCWLQIQRVEKQEPKAA